MGTLEVFVGSDYRPRFHQIQPQQITPQINPVAYAALCAQKSVRKATCFSGGTRSARSSTSQTIFAAAKRQPIIPATLALRPTSINIKPMGFHKSRQVNFGFEPMRAKKAAGRPRNNPTHHVASVPHPKASNVGSLVPKIGSCPMVKYSTHIRAVI